MPHSRLTGLSRFFEGLAGRLLLLSAIVILTAEAFIFAPSIAAFHTLRINDRLNLAETAAIAFADRQELSPELERSLVENAQILRIAMSRDDLRELMLESPLPEDAAGMPRTLDFRIANEVTRVGWAFETLLAPPGQVLRVVAAPRIERGDFIEILISAAPLKREMAAYARQVFVSSILVSALAGVIVYLLLTWLFVRPMETLTARIEAFRDAPEDASIFRAPSARADEIGRAERAAADMAEHVRASLRQRERLANLGAAVARIAHDLRNALGTAQLVAERLSRSDQPAVREGAERLERAIGRAAGLAAAALRYGKAEDAALTIGPIGVRAAAAEALEEALAPFPAQTYALAASEELVVAADGELLHRILVNLLRNAAQASALIEGGAERPITLRARRAGKDISLAVIDQGPGVPDSARAHLFEAFVSADRAGGAGLGLAIARELARAQGGEVSLAETGPGGSTFEVRLPSA